MSNYKEYLKENKDRNALGLKPKPIDDGNLLSEIITNIKDLKFIDRDTCIDFFIYKEITYLFFIFHS